MRGVGIETCKRRHALSRALQPRHRKLIKLQPLSGTLHLATAAAAAEPQRATSPAATTTLLAPTTRADGTCRRGSAAAAASTAHVSLASPAFPSRSRRSTAAQTQRHDTQHQLLVPAEEALPQPRYRSLPELMHCLCTRKSGKVCGAPERRYVPSPS